MMAIDNAGKKTEASNNGESITLEKVSISDLVKSGIVKDGDWINYPSVDIQKRWRVINTNKTTGGNNNNESKKYYCGDR